jgi:hypothetical protein
MKAIGAGSFTRIFGQRVAVDHVSFDRVPASSRRWRPTSRGPNRNLDEMQPIVSNDKGTTGSSSE